MNATHIVLTNNNRTLANVVAHECSCGEFATDIDREVGRFIGKGKCSLIDIFWHLDEYCEKKYGSCHWQEIDIRNFAHRAISIREEK